MLDRRRKCIHRIKAMYGKQNCTEQKTINTFLKDCLFMGKLKVQTISRNKGQRTQREGPEYLGPGAEKKNRDGRVEEVVRGSENKSNK